MQTPRLEDPALVAALTTINPQITVIPVRTPNGRIAFDLSKNDLTEEISRLHGGESAPLRDFIKNLKELRSTIFTLKDSK